MLKPRRVSEMMETAGVAAAIESVSGKIYVGVCVDGGCTLGSVYLRSSQNSQPNSNASDMNSRKERGRVFRIARSDSPPAF